MMSMSLKGDQVSSGMTIFRQLEWCI